MVGIDVRSSLRLTAMNVIALSQTLKTSSYAREISMQTLNGFVNFLSKFLTHLADQIELIHCLTRQDTEFNWTEEHKNTFRKVKHLVITTPSPNTITTRRLLA